MGSKDLTHEIIKDLKRVALELNNPALTRSEYLTIGKFSKRRINEVFSSWTIARISAGLESSRQKSKKEMKSEVKERITQVYKRNIDELLEMPKLGASIPHFETFEPTIALGDMHCPWWDKEKIEKVLAFCEFMIGKGLVKNVAQCGDAFDLLAYSRFPSPKTSVLPPDIEIDIARTQLEFFWGSIRDMIGSKDIRMIQLLGNHDARGYISMINKNPEIEYETDFRKKYLFDGVETHFNLKEPFVIGGNVAYTHGYKGQIGLHRSQHKMHVVRCHTHRPGLVWNPVETVASLNTDKTARMLFEMDLGYLGDPSSKAFSYLPGPEPRWAHAIGYISEFGPNIFEI